MTGITVVCVGKLKEKFYAQAAQEYQKRLHAYGRVAVVELPEAKLPAEPGQKLIEKALIDEAQRIRDAIPKGAFTIALCIEGKMLSSEQMADMIKDIQITGRSSICFLIGGSYGLSQELKQQADIMLSMSKMTFPHHLARIMVLEQIYRAFQILSGGQYHK